MNKEIPRIEKAVIGALIQDNGLLATAYSHSITADSFSHPLTQQLYEFINETVNSGSPVDLVLLGKNFSEQIADIAVFDLEFSTTVNFSDWMKRLKEAEAKRMMLAGCARIQPKLTDPKTDALQICNEFQAVLENTFSCADNRKAPTLEDNAKEIENHWNGSPPPVIPLFPEGTEGARDVKIHPGEMFVLGAKTGSGKTAFCAAAVWEQLQANWNVAYFCTESSSKEILERIVAAASGIPHYDEDRTPETMSKRMAILHTLTENYFRKLHIRGCESGFLTPSKIRQQLRAWETDGTPQIVYVDFLQNVFPDKAGRSPLEATNTMIQSIHDILIQFNAAGIIVCQFNREGQKTGNLNGDVMPDHTWLKDSSLIEQLAHTVAFLWKPKKENETKFYTLKTRNTHSFSLKLNWSKTKFLSAKIPFSDC